MYNWTRFSLYQCKKSNLKYNPTKLIVGCTRGIWKKTNSMRYIYLLIRDTLGCDDLIDIWNTANILKYKTDK